MTLLLRKSDLEGLVDMRSTIDAVERALGDIARGMAAQPAPPLMRIAGSDAGFLPLAALSSNDGLAAVKLLADIPGNASAGLPTQRSSIVLTSAATGEVLAILDGKVPTRMRTAAATAVATRHLARPDSSTLGLIGAGALAVAHVEALREVLPLERVVFWTRRSETAAAFEAAVAQFGIPVKAVASPDAVFEHADTVCTLTPAQQPVAHGAAFRPGQHINAVGARPRPEEREIDSLGIQRATVFVDHLPTARAKAGDLLIPQAEGVFSFDDVSAELGSVIAGQAVGRSSDDEITLLKSVGLGIQDLAVGRLLLERATAENRGISIDFAS